MTPEEQACLDALAAENAALRDKLNRAECICPIGSTRADCPAHAFYCSHGHLLGQHECDDSATGRGMKHDVYLMRENTALRARLADEKGAADAYAMRLAEAEALLKETREEWIDRDSYRDDTTRYQCDQLCERIDAFLAPDSATPRENERG